MEAEAKNKDTRNEMLINKLILTESDDKNDGVSQDKIYREDLKKKKGGGVTYTTTEKACVHFGKGDMKKIKTMVRYVQLQNNIWYAILNIMGWQWLCFL